MAKLKELTLELPALPSDILPESISLQRITSLLPQKKELALFRERANPDPVLAVNIFGFWFSIYKWE